MTVKETIRQVRQGKVNVSIIIHHYDYFDGLDFCCLSTLCCVLDLGLRLGVKVRVRYRVMD